MSACCMFPCHFFVNIQTNPTGESSWVADWLFSMWPQVSVMWYFVRWRKYLEEIQKWIFFTMLTNKVPFQVVWKCQYIFSIDKWWRIFLEEAALKMKIYLFADTFVKIHFPYTLNYYNEMSEQATMMLCWEEWTTIFLWVYMHTNDW